MKNLIKVTFGILLGIILTFASLAWDNPASSFSGATNILRDQGILIITDEAIQYEPNDSTFSVQELEALAKIATLREGMYIVSPQ